MTSQLNIEKLRRALAIAEQIQQLETQLVAVLKGETPATPVKIKGKRTLSPEGLKRIRAAQKKRWKLHNAANGSKPKLKYKRSAATRARMSAAQKKRHAAKGITA